MCKLWCRILVLGLWLSSVMLSQTVTAQKPDEKSALVKELLPFVVELNQPFFVYHWFDGAGREPIWTSAGLSAHAKEGYDLFLNGTHNYYQAMCTNDPQHDPSDCDSADVTHIVGRGDVFGAGLYASPDPFATNLYGGMGDSWVLMQIRLPKGMRMINFQWPSDSMQPLSTAAQQELTDMGCKSAGEMGYDSHSVSGALTVIAAHGRV